MAWHGVAYVCRPPALCEVGRSLLEEGLELIDGGAAQLDERWSEQRDLFALRVSAPLVEGLRVVRPQVQVAKSAPRRNRLGVLQQHAAKASAASRRVNHDRCDGRGEAVRILARRLKPTVCYDRVIRIQQEQVARDLVLFCLAHMRQQGGAAASGARGGPLRGEQRSGGADEIRPVAEQDARRRRRNCRRRHYSRTFLLVSSSSQSRFSREDTRTHHHANVWFVSQTALSCQRERRPLTTITYESAAKPESPPPSP